ncbi:MAG: hypothetical protein A2756_04740 [Candidatus Ryanbacteria bacterium RIFCSPHIGHO2_01_FULL_48_27]|uniref:Uncharacterized protein n=1 Tax=Candidatus Ryanbacteria bacterium RIFCSPHIGHO2_01_FULL_48_27 TaxID=1802115 RepID=A0A1G2FZU8_9BACT|nr:MAG: hypothetical protein A2756_04740 [Candidatus Ryanbacteria bacterium RIFCSPHIGHO2_01_FULL_48_27]
MYIGRTTDSLDAAAIDTAPKASGAVGDVLFVVVSAGALCVSETGASEVLACKEPSVSTAAG